MEMMKRGRDASKRGPDQGSITRRTLLAPPPPPNTVWLVILELNLSWNSVGSSTKRKKNLTVRASFPPRRYFGTNFHVRCRCLISAHEPPPHPPPPLLFTARGQLGRGGAPPDRSITKSTQSAVCDRIHANKAFNYSVRGGRTRRGLSDSSLLITINL